MAIFRRVRFRDKYFHTKYPPPDYQQYLTGSCGQQDIAGRVMTRVIDHKPRQNLIIVDCGFTALSHDGMRQRPTDFCVIEGETNLR